MKVFHTLLRRPSSGNVVRMQLSPDWSGPCTGIWWRVSVCLEVGYDTTPLTLVAHYTNHISALTLHNLATSSS
jgi:hypothetical protein